MADKVCSIDCLALHTPAGGLASMTRKAFLWKFHLFQLFRVPCDQFLYLPNSSSPPPPPVFRVFDTLINCNVCVFYKSLSPNFLVQHPLGISTTGPLLRVLSAWAGDGDCFQWHTYVQKESSWNGTLGFPDSLSSGFFVCCLFSFLFGFRHAAESSHFTQIWHCTVSC